MTALWQTNITHDTIDIGRVNKILSLKTIRSQTIFRVTLKTEWFCQLKCILVPELTDLVSEYCGKDIIEKWCFSRIFHEPIIHWSDKLKESLAFCYKWISRDPEVFPSETFTKIQLRTISLFDTVILECRLNREITFGKNRSFCTYPSSIGDLIRYIEMYKDNATDNAFRPIPSSRKRVLILNNNVILQDENGFEIQSFI